MAKGTEVAVPETPSELLAKTFEEAAREMVADNNTSEEILLEILNAPTVADILGSTAIGLDSIIGQPFTIHKAELQKSDFEDGLAAYVVLHSEMDSGERCVITSGAQSVVAQAIRMNQLGAFPQRVSSKKAVKPTKNGYYPIELIAAPERPESF